MTTGGAGAPVRIRAGEYYTAPTGADNGTLIAAFEPRQGETFFCRVPFPLEQVIVVTRVDLPPELCPRFELLPDHPSGLPQYREVEWSG